MIQKVYRKFNFLISLLGNFLRITHLRLQYEGISIKGKTFISRNCDIRCTKGAVLILENVFLSRNCQIIVDDMGYIAIKDSYIGISVIIVAAEKIIIDKNCQIAEMVTIRDQNHNYNDSNKPIKEQGFSSAPIYISENVWVGAKCTILKNVSIGNNTVIGANSLVNKNCEANSVYVGIPAKKIK